MAAVSNEQFSLDDYTVAWICALPLEMAAAKAMLDLAHPNLPAAPDDHNNYQLGQIQGHNIVIACLPAGVYGTTPAATVAKDLMRTFKSIRFGLMVGVGGGVPSESHDIRLGDIVVSQPSGTTGGVIQYDRGKTTPQRHNERTNDIGRHESRGADFDEHFERTGSLNAPPQVVLTALSRLQADHLMGTSRIPEYLSTLVDRYPKMKAFTFQGQPNDCLFQSDYKHVDPNAGCDQCDLSHVVHRDARDDNDPVVHYGNIGSGNQVIKSADLRNRLGKELGVLCFEMEAAGLMQDFPCLVIRGICDYSDSHKNKRWQQYAAATAAAFSKELLSIMAPHRLLQERTIPQLVSDPVLHQLVSRTKDAISQQTEAQGVRYENEKQMRCHQNFKTFQYEAFKDINPDRVPGTCKWVLEHPKYTQWHQSPTDDLLWISADPGCGKSVLARSLINRELQSTRDRTVCYFFFKDNDEQNKLATALCAILHQLFTSMPWLLHHAAQAFDTNGPKLQTEIGELWNILLAAGTDKSAKSVICVLDALDECQWSDCQRLISLLTAFYAQKSSAPERICHLKFLVTSRPYEDIEFRFKDIPRDLPSIRLAGEEKNAEISDEIDLVIRRKILNSGDRLHPDQTVRDAIEAKLLGTPNRTYLWLHLVWAELEGSDKRTKKGYLKTIDTLPLTLEMAYEKILSRCESRHRKYLQVLLHIVVGAQRPLTLGEMDVAFQLATDAPNALQHADLDLDGVCLTSRIRKLCGLFVFINDDRVYLIHQTAKEFLVSREGCHESNTTDWKGSLEKQVSSQLMTSICVQYLSFVDIPDDQLGTQFIGQREPQGVRCSLVSPFLEYSSANWPTHLRDLVAPDEHMFSRSLTLYDSTNPRYRTWIFFFFEAAYPHATRIFGFEPIHLAAYLGQEKIVARLIQSNQDIINQCDGDAYTPLRWACFHGYRGVVELLLDEGAGENRYCECCALCAAVEGGHHEIVQLLLDRYINPPRGPGAFGRPLMLASRPGHLETVELLLDRGADVNARFVYDCCDNAPSIAAKHGHLEIVRLLLNRGADIDAAGWNSVDGALQFAASSGHRAIVELCLAAGMDINARSSCRDGALQSASANGRRDMVEFLLERGADINMQSGHYGSALQAATFCGQYDIVELLLDRGADTELDGYGGTALELALSNHRRTKIVGLLRRRFFLDSTALHPP